jgi:hypothetical protein
MTGHTALLIRRRRPTGEPEDVQAGPAPGFGFLEGAAGVGRALNTLASLGLEFDEVVQAIFDPDVDPTAIAAVQIGRKFETTILASHLVNNVDPEVRRAWLALAARHVPASGRVLVEHHPLDWAETAAEVQPTPGAPGMLEVRADPPFVSAMSVYDVGGRMIRKPFRARVLSDADLASELAAAGVALTGRLGPTWVEGRLMEQSGPAR